MKASDFTFDLPAESIASEPPPHRRDARLLHLPSSGAPVHRRFVDLATLLREGDLLVLNETRVLPARLETRRAGGGAVELFLLEEVEDGAWRALARPLKRLREGEFLDGVAAADGAFRARVVRRGEGEIRVTFEDAAGRRVDGGAVLETWGAVPLPPYVRRAPTSADRLRYQTVFARVPGAVAAPTAGLHFDEALLDEIRGRGVHVANLVLHVGLGTFRPLPDGDEELSAIRLDAERFEIPAATLAAVVRARSAGRRVVACGTTVVRALETAAREIDFAAPPSPAHRGSTTLFIFPPFAFRVVDALVTNFHLPRSSLLCLAAAFAGRERILAAYDLAVREGYRFYSYGDATFLERAS